jgi:uncharacterized protein (TIRG00374 family)
LQPRFLIGVAVSVFFLIWLFRGTDLSSVGEALAEANYLLLPPALGVIFVALWLRALRWHFLLEPFRPIPTTRLFPVLVIGYMANSLLPARAGELIRVYLIGKREGVDKATVLAGILLERVFDGIVLLMMLVLALALAPFEASWLGDLVRAALGIFVGTLIFFVALIARPDWTLRLTDWCVNRLPAGVRPTVAGLAAGFLAGLRVLGRPRTLLAVTVTSILGWVVDIGLMYLILGAFATTVPVRLMVIDMAVGNLATSAPATIGGIGPFEFFTAEVLKLGQVDPAIAAAFALLMHFAFIGPVVLLGVVFLWLENVRPARLAELSEGE